MFTENGFVLITGEDDAPDVLDKLQDVLAKCYHIGTRLNLNASFLDVLRAEKLTHVEAMERIIIHWLRMNYDVERFGPPTWKALIEAVEHRLGGNNHRLAMDIISKLGGNSCSVLYLEQLSLLRLV